MLLLCRHPVPLSDILCIFFLSDILPYTNRKFRHYSVCILLSSHLLISRSSTNILYSFVVYTDIPCPPFCHFLSAILTSSSRILNHTVKYSAIFLSTILPSSFLRFRRFPVQYSVILLFSSLTSCCQIFCPHVVQHYVIVPSSSLRRPHVYYISTLSVFSHPVILFRFFL